MHAVTAMEVNLAYLTVSGFIGFLAGMARWGLGGNLATRNVALEGILLSLMCLQLPTTM